MAGAAKAVVIGGGVVGLCTAIRLAERRFSVTIIDQPPPLGAPSWGNIGHIAAEQCAPLASWSNIRSIPRRLSLCGGAVGLPLSAATAWLPFGLKMVRAASHSASGTHVLTGLLQEAMPAWRRLDESWPQASVLREEGHFVIWESDKTATAGRNAWQQAAKGSTSFRDATAAELRGLANLAPGSSLHAIRFSQTGKITSLQQLRENLHARLADLGSAVWMRKVARLQEKAQAAEIVLDDGEIISPELIVVCGGVGSAQLLEPLGHRVPLIAERGYHIEYEASPLDAETPPMAFEDRSVVVNRFQHGLRIAGFVEFAKLSTPVDERKWQRLERHLEELGFAHSGAKRRWMGARPTLPDYLPAIGRSDKAPNVFYAFGHQHLGLTLAPITAEKITKLTVGGSVDALLSLRRFE